MAGNMSQMTVGGYLYEQPGIIESVDFEIPEDSPWEIGIPLTGNEGEEFEDTSVKELPHIIKVSMKFTPIHRFRPSINTISTATAGDDGFTDYNLDEANEIITIGDDTLSVTWYLSSTDANDKTNPIDASRFNNATANTVFARIENSAGCHSISTVNLDVSSTSFDNSYLGESIVICDNFGENDGISLFDLSQLSGNIIGQFPDPDISAHYYRNIDDAQLEQNEITA